MAGRVSNGQGEENNIGHDEPEATAEDAQAQVDPSFCAAAERAAVATTAEPAAPRELYGSREAFRATVCAPLPGVRREGADVGGLAGL